MLKEKLQELFRKVFQDPTIVLTEETTAADVKGWDSIAHLDLILAVEKEFQIQFSTAELGRMRNVGDFLRLIEKRKGP